MVWKCEVLGCPSTRNSGVKMHNIRRDKHLRKKWLRAIGKENLFEHPNITKRCVCDLHFSEKQKFAANAKNRTNLVCHAVPDCNLPGEEMDCIETVEVASSENNLDVDCHYSSTPSSDLTAEAMDCIEIVELDFNDPYIDIHECVEIVDENSGMEEDNTRTDLTSVIMSSADIEPSEGSIKSSSAVPRSASSNQTSKIVSEVTPERLLMSNFAQEDMSPLHNSEAASVESCSTAVPTSASGNETPKTVSEDTPQRQSMSNFGREEMSLL